MTDDETAAAGTDKNIRSFRYKDQGKGDTQRKTPSPPIGNLSAEIFREKAR